MTTRSDTNETFGPGGQLLSSHQVTVDTTVEVNEKAIRDGLVAAMASLQATIDTPPTNVAQCSARIVQQAQILRRLIRLTTRLLEDQS